jgi:ribosomal protein S18 acetylase RimI-like enzyme
MDMYRFQSLQEVSLEQIALCFNLAFSDYEQSISFTPESLKYYLTASAVDLSLSFGAFCGEEMVGFILNAGGVYNDESVVFDAGTGVVPGHRGKGVFSQLFDFTCQQLQDRGVAKYYLEVLQSNDHAVAIYSKKGFTVRREYAVLVASGLKRAWDGAVMTAPYGEFMPFATVCSVAPSFEHTTFNVNQNPQLYEVGYLGDRAYCIYAKRNGEIIQMHYNELDALKEVMSMVTEKYPKSMAKNVDCGCADVLQMLTGIGYREFLKQYEMVRDI